MVYADPNQVVAENSTFPAVCETCLGDDPYVRMTKKEYGSACKMCDRPMTHFRWKAGKKGRFKETIICQHCAKAKNLCQTCLLDLEFGLPVQVRDKFLAERNLLDSAPKSEVGKIYQAQYLGTDDSNQGKLSTLSEIKKLARLEPHYERNDARECSFFAKGFCSRGSSCPFKHTIKTDDEGSRTNVNKSIKDRYHGKNDLFAQRILSEQEPARKKQKQTL